MAIAKVEVTENIYRVEVVPPAPGSPSPSQSVKVVFVGTQGPEGAIGPQGPAGSPGPPGETEIFNFIDWQNVGNKPAVIENLSTDGLINGGYF